MGPSAEDDDASFCRREPVARCPVCDGGSRRMWLQVSEWLYGLPGQFPIARCQHCGLGYLAERPSREDLGLYYPDEAYYAYRKPAAYSLFWRRDAVAGAWYLTKKSVLSHSYGYRHFGGSRWLARILSLPLLGGIRRRASFDLNVLLHPWVEGGSLLEVGCGAGMYLDLMRALGWKRVVGVDFSEKAVAQARETLGLEVYCGELTALALEADSFDAVSLSHTLEHIPDPVPFLAEARRVMKPGGRLGIVVPNLESLCCGAFGQYWVGLDPPRHLLDFTVGSLRLALERAGLVVESISTTPRGGYHVALYSHSRRSGDPRTVYADSEHRFPLHRRARALALSLLERLQCIVGRPVGEEVVAVARKPA